MTTRTMKMSFIHAAFAIFLFQCFVVSSARATEYPFCDEQHSATRDGYYKELVAQCKAGPAPLVGKYTGYAGLKLGVAVYDGRVCSIYGIRSGGHYLMVMNYSDDRAPVVLRAKYYGGDDQLLFAAFADNPVLKKIFGSHVDLVLGDIDDSTDVGYYLLEAEPGVGEPAVATCPLK